ncbi:MarR family transcriptional regulator [Pusillimonas sp. CC-YST705]|uniref:MarR family transcriptional regulator n=1 Tax=Mesopusillimonas faecipullorum TaxID=2755040 RepID=A0ABS8CDG4_9BURK|nr:MarR family transcriptional regulator [Mesopusillimonas faecipullorum]MCB5363859.1 MarR family transcriptional regulator [Mesopusillimonas faecipullorum]
MATEKVVSSRGLAEPVQEGINPLADSLAYQIKQTQVRCYEMLFELLGPQSLSPGRMTALSLIGNYPGIKQSELAEHLRVNRASVVKVIDSLQALGFVERGSIPGDRRSHALAVTPAGVAELQRLTQLIHKHEAMIATELTLDERDMLMGLLAKVARQAKRRGDE